MTRQLKAEGIEDLYTFAAQEGETLEQFTDRLTAEF